MNHDFDDGQQHTNQSVPRDWQMLHALQEDDYDLAKDLIERGYDVNSSVRANPYPMLFYAATACPDGDILQLFLDHGADPNMRAADGKTLIDHVATGYGEHFYRVNATRRLLVAGVDVNTTDDKGNTILDKVVSQARRQLDCGHSNSWPESPELLVTQYLIRMLEANGAKCSSQASKLTLQGLKRQFEDELAINSHGRARH